MHNTLLASARLLLVATMAVFLSACGSKNDTVVPDTMPGDQLLDAYLYGEWCTNREETSNANRSIGLSALINVSPVFWNFAEDGTWSTSNSGFLFERHGTWKLDGLNTLLLAKDGMAPNSFQAQFKNNGADLYLIDEKEQFLVVAHCD